MSRINWDLVRRNIEEAREQLEDLEKRIASQAKPNEAELEIALNHAYHHLNFAWNVRRVAIGRYRDMTDAEFNEWGRKPKEMRPIKVSIPREKT